jgi:hypothetical protein
MKNTNRWIALSVLFALMLSTLGTAFVTPAEASTKGRRNTTIALGALTAYGLVKKKKTLAIAGGLGTAYAYTRYRKSKKADKRRAAARRNYYGYRYRR